MRRPVVEIVCDRCRRTENQEPSSSDIRPEFRGVFHGKKVQFEDLCQSCRKAIENYFQRIARETEKKPSEVPLEPEKEEKKKNPKE